MKYLFVLAFVFSSFAFGEIIPKEWVSGEHKSVQINSNVDVKYPMVRLKSEGAIPVILLHGFGGNAHNWMEVGSDLYNAGYDVWAFTWTVNHGRNIDEAGRKTVKEIVDYVYKQTGQKAFLAGHSLGGIVSKLYIFGVRVEESTGKYMISEKAIKQVKKRLRGFVSVASPNGLFLEEATGMLHILGFAPDSEIITTANLSELIKRRKLAFDLWVAMSYETSVISSRMPMVKNFVESLFYMKNHDFFDYNLGKFFRYCFNPVPKKIVEQLKLGKDALISPDGNLNYTDIFLNAKRTIPIAYISAEHDKLAPAKAIREEFKKNSYFLELKDAGHVDPIVGDLSHNTVLFMNKFFLKNI